MVSRTNDFNEGPARIARARLRDAQVLLKAKLRRCVLSFGYAVELALKAAICRTTQMARVSAERAEFEISSR
jgi:hypothetical protein